MFENQFPLIDVGGTGERLKAVCIERNVSARELQTLLNLGSVQAVYNWYSGSRLPTVDNLFAISKLLQVPMDDLLVEKCGKCVKNL